MINRRSFISSMVAGFLSLVSDLFASEEPGYILDWNQPGGINRTTHPKYTNPPYGRPPINRVWLNGVEISKKHITCLKTGKDGWVEISVRDSNGQTAIDHLHGCIITKTWYGNVVWQHTPKA